MVDCLYFAAVQRGITTKDLYEEYGLDLED